MSKFTEVQKRAWLAGRLKVEDVDDVLWNELKDLQYVAEADDTVGRNILLREARRLIRVARRMAGRPAPPGRRRGGVSQGPLATDYESIRAEIVAEHVAGLAAATPEVRAFRADVLEAKLLDEELAATFLRSEATCLFTLRQFRRWGIPILHHYATRALDEQHRDGDRLFHERVVFITEKQRSYRRRYNIAWKPSALGATPDATHYLANLPRPSALATLDTYRDQGPILVWPDSVLDELRKVAERLSQAYHWDVGEATWFILTGIHPAVPTLRGAYESASLAFGDFGAITLVVAPWESADKVLRTYRHLQRDVLGGDNRQIGERNLALFRFIRQHRQCGGNKMSWRELLQQWNQQFPQWRCDDHRRLARDYERTQKALLPKRRDTGPRSITQTSM